jgi:hypothetical protein
LRRELCSIRKVKMCIAKERSNESSGNIRLGFFLFYCRAPGVFFVSGERDAHAKLLEKMSCTHSGTGHFSYSESFAAMLLCL